ncbi:MAG: hypothetical protein RMZ42_07735 [Nostoc sp. DedQUE05]|uniref:hypothetical protein n=1 Tax=Nostoc sp. DedQUE05 TaxID=3075391 RepID=UPI002AD302F5|nr:hypothetical protein [Nostoc sp. DedQUE05]MDZ8091820.1 hypothetical protein [Nostoc sp. DedQUE05]
MPRLTVPPNFIGTSGIDTLAAEESNASVAIGIDILNGGVINTFSGNDSISGTGKPSTGSTKPKKPVIGIGINNSGTLYAGDGSDMIAGIGTGLKFIGTGINNSSSLNAGNGIGISNSGSLKAGNGNDTITGTSTGVTPIGISNSGSFDAGNGNDTITGTGTGGTGFRVFGTPNALKDRKGDTGIGISNSGSFDAWYGNDTITGVGTGSIGIQGGFQGGDNSKGGDGGTGIGISNSGNFDAGNGNDTITGIGTGGNGREGTAYAFTASIPPSIFRGESGDGGNGIGISNSGSFDVGDGNDTITGTGTGGTGGTGSEGFAQDTTSNYTSVDESGDGGAKIGTTSIGIQNIKKAIITTGENKDTIKGSATSLEANILAYGIFNDSIIDTGNDRDILTGQATTTIGGIAYGIYGQGIIRTGDGNDKITATNNIDKVQQKVTIGGGIRFELGTGNDYFKGFGSAIVDGGSGFDTLDVSAFKRSEVSVSGVISSNSLNPANITFNNNDNLITLSTIGFENFIFADSSFSYSSLA